MSTGLRTLPSNLAARGGFWRPKLFETFGVSRPPGAYLPCFFPANVVPATAPAAPPSTESIQRIWSNGVILGDGSRRRHLPMAGSFPMADSRMPPRPSRAWYGRPCAALTSSTTSPHQKTCLRCPRGSLPGPLHPPQPLPLRGGAGLSDASPRSRFKETRGTFPPAVVGRFASAGPPPTAGLPSAIAPAVLPTPVLRVGPNFGAIVGAIFNFT